MQVQVKKPEDHQAVAHGLQYRMIPQSMIMENGKKQFHKVVIRGLPWIVTPEVVQDYFYEIGFWWGTVSLYQRTNWKQTPIFILKISSQLQLDPSKKSEPDIGLEKLLSITEILGIRVQVKLCQKSLNVSHNASTVRNMDMCRSSEKTALSTWNVWEDTSVANAARQKKIHQDVQTVEKTTLLVDWGARKQGNHENTTGS